MMPCRWLSLNTTYCGVAPPMPNEKQVDSDRRLCDQMRCSSAITIRRAVSLTRGHILTGATDLAGNDNALDFRGAFADAQQSVIAPETLDIIFLHQPIATVDLHGHVRHFARHFGAVQLGHSRFFAKGLILVGHPADLV